MNKQNLDILRVLEEQGFKAYVVGGYVRDYLMKKNFILLKASVLYACL